MPRCAGDALEIALPPIMMTCVPHGDVTLRCSAPSICWHSYCNATQGQATPIYVSTAYRGCVLCAYLLCPTCQASESRLTHGSSGSKHIHGHAPQAISHGRAHILHLQTCALLVKWKMCSRSARLDRLKFSLATQGSLRPSYYSSSCCTHHGGPASGVGCSHGSGHGNGSALQCPLHHSAGGGSSQAERRDSGQQLWGQPREHGPAGERSRKGQRHLRRAW